MEIQQFCLLGLELLHYLLLFHGVALGMYITRNTQDEA